MYFLVLFLGVYSGQCRGMSPCPEDHPGGEASLPTHFPLLHSQRGTQSARLSLPRRGDILTPWQCWCHFHAAHKGWTRHKCNTLENNDIHLKQSRYSNHFSLSLCSLTCPSGWMKPILCFRRGLVCWSWSTELSAYAAKTQNLNFSRLFTFLPNTGLGFYATISLITTVTACVCLWPVSVCVCVCFNHHQYPCFTSPLHNCQYNIT